MGPNGRRAIERYMIAFKFASLITGIVLMLTGGIGCMSFSDAAHRTKGTLAIGLFTASESWQTLDMEKQQSILAQSNTRAQFDASISIYRSGEQAKAVQAFKSARYALQLLTSALASYDAGAAKDKDVTQALFKAIEAGKALIVLLQTIGVKIELPEILKGGVL